MNMRMQSAPSSNADTKGLHLAQQLSHAETHAQNLAMRNVYESTTGVKHPSTYANADSLLLADQSEMNLIKTQSIISDKEQVLEKLQHAIEIVQLTLDLSLGLFQDASNLTLTENATDRTNAIETLTYKLKDLTKEICENKYLRSYDSPNTIIMKHQLDSTTGVITEISRDLHHDCYTVLDTEFNGSGGFPDFPTLEAAIDVWMLDPARTDLEISAAIEKVCNELTKAPSKLLAKGALIQHNIDVQEKHADFFERAVLSNRGIAA
jgi:hypothetical protein